MKIDDVGLGSIELWLSSQGSQGGTGSCMHKHLAGLPTVPFAHEFTTTPVNRRSHARQGVPWIWVVALQFNGTQANIINFHA